MNYLAHAFLAQPTLASLTGNLLGDFCKGVNITELPADIKAGLDNHRAVDRYTDQHPLIKQAKQQFSASQRRFAGVALDVLFDHYLIKHWSSYNSLAYQDYKNRLYRQLQLALPLMPAQMATIMRKVVQQDWFKSYETLPDTARAVTYIASRIRFDNHFSDAVNDIRIHYDNFEQIFLHFFPQLQQHVISLQLESA